MVKGLVWGKSVLNILEPNSVHCIAVLTVTPWCKVVLKPESLCYCSSQFGSFLFLVQFVSLAGQKLCNTARARRYAMFDNVDYDAAGHLVSSCPPRGIQIPSCTVVAAAGLKGKPEICQGDTLCNLCSTRKHLCQL